MKKVVGLAELAECLGDVLELPRGGLREQSPLEDVEGWDSVNALRVLTGIESEWGVRLKLQEFGQARTVGELLALVNREVRHADAA